MDIVLKHRNVRDFQVKDDILGFYMIRLCEAKITVAGAKYLNINLGDATGEINAKLWEVTPGLAEKLSVGTIVRVMGVVIDYQGTAQLKLEKIRTVNEEDNVDISDLIPAAPFDPEEMFEYLYDTANSFNNKDLKNITVKILSKYKTKLLYYPGAKRNHHSIKAGLLYHTATMLKTAQKVCEVYEFLNKELLYAGVILHDIAKTDEMESNEFGIVEQYSIEGNLIGHIVKGAIIISKIGEELNIDNELILLLSHMIISHHNNPEYGSPKYPLTPEAEMLHHLDMIDARMYDMQKATENMDCGAMSDKVWSLDGRQVYKSEKY